MSNKYTWRLLEGNVYGQYACRIVGSILFHSVPYELQDKSTLEWWEYDKLGKSASLGCVRLTVEDAKWIYDKCVSGTKVEFYSSETPGPLGKPTTKKISGDEKVRNWDPTDPDKDNPWKSYVKEPDNKNNNSVPVTSKPEDTNTARNNQVNKPETDTNTSKNPNENNNQVNNNVVDTGVDKEDTEKNETTQDKNEKPETVKSTVETEKSLKV